MAKRAVFVSYRSIIDLENPVDAVTRGWHHRDDRSVLALPTGIPTELPADLLERAMIGLGTESDETSAVKSPDDAEERKSLRARGLVDQVHPELMAAIDHLDHVVLYIGVTAADEVIQLAKQIQPEKLTFVMCSCDVTWKRELIAQAGLSGAKIFITEECGGEVTMGELYQSFLESGELPAEQS